MAVLNRISQKKGAFCVFTCVGLIIHVSVTYLLPISWFNKVGTEQKLHDSKFDNVNASARQQPKKILIWNRYWKSWALWNKVFSEIIERNCPVINCVLTMDKEELNSSDAILLHLPDFRSNYELPPFRRSDQIWIAMTYEPPSILTFTGLELGPLNGLFNRTMSYRTDSDIVVRHGNYKRLQDKGKKAPPRYRSSWVNSRDDPKKRNYAAGKRRLVSWFASSRGCRSESGREKYVKALQEYIEVDIYGICGPFKCGVHKTVRHPYKVEHDDCYFLVSLGYKFVLAFENSICDDYVTEKLYNNLKLNVVPVVLGGSNYSVVAPPHSVIDAARMSPKELAQYLLLLDRNDTMYNEYFSWKKNYYIESNDGVPSACDLCSKLNEPAWALETKVYEHFDTWMTSKCRKGYGNNR